MLSFFLGTINIYQPSTLNSDGSGSLKLSYFTSDSNLIANNVLGNYPFLELKLGVVFHLQIREVKGVKVYNDKDKSVTHVVLEIDFKDINKISEAKGFSDLKQFSSGMC